MQIQWYPGHMHKAGKEMKEILPQVDLIIEVLDARIPFSSENPFLATLRGDKPCIKVLSKSDLADAERTTQWQHFLEQERGVKALAITTEQPDKTKQLFDLCRKLAPNKVQNDKTIFAMITGIPNVGKSTLINILAGKTIAKTGNEPAVTKGQQRIHIDKKLILIDTPGMLWPNIENPHSGYRLAVTGGIKETALDNDDIAFYAAEFFLQHYPEALQQRYALKTLPETEMDFLEQLGRQRGCLRAGGHIDLEKVAKIFLTEIRAGTLGPVTFETPEMMQQEWQEVERVREEKAAKKKARLEKRKKRKKRKR